MKRLDWASPRFSHHGLCFWRRVIAAELRQHLRHTENRMWLRQSERLLDFMRNSTRAWSEASEQAGVIDDPFFNLEGLS